MLLSNVGLRETTPSLHTPLNSDHGFLRHVMQGHVAFKALGVFAAINNFLVSFTAHLDESSKNIATFSRNSA